MKTCVFLTTRYGSTRLPKKHLMNIGNETVTDILIERIKSAGLPVIMTTPCTPEDNLYMGSLAKKHGIGYYAGDIDNIIQRHLDCAAMNEVDWIINVDGDDILTCPDLIETVYRTIEGGMGGDCIHLYNYPLGMNLIAYRPSRLAQVNYSKDTNWGAKILALGASGMEGILFNDCRLTLDYIEDYFVIRHIILELGKEADSREICEFMLKHQELCHTNKFRNEEYFQRLEDMSK
jgi:spore coat polysaccharide biosynthesis protein SpsF (cytidylyltransferase family)